MQFTPYKFAAMSEALPPHRAAKMESTGGKFQLPPIREALPGQFPYGHRLPICSPPLSLPLPNHGYYSPPPRYDMAPVSSYQQPRAIRRVCKVEKKHPRRKPCQKSPRCNDKPQSAKAAKAVKEQERREDLGELVIDYEKLLEYMGDQDIKNEFFKRPLNQGNVRSSRGLQHNKLDVLRGALKQLKRWYREKHELQEEIYKLRYLVRPKRVSTEGLYSQSLRSNKDLTQHLRPFTFTSQPSPRL
ncbi:hypothetical protein K469DRAFT_183240 [Zopfia rhizophila CBS 207.26]|uniref:Uncharacterized protein n=1 Tax=Zopfia rhizophila CBS 207.26 TaxID=1314779 RepID=A0A6A6E129_9PEZI|nr:hypothetical protein K469DRAFT_183240 [Zopfia rhizophila CBS 207.26]